MTKPKDLTGQKFGKLTVLSKGPSDKFKKQDGIANVNVAILN